MAASKERALAALLLNIFCAPGLGTLIGGWYGVGVAQLAGLALAFWLGTQAQASMIFSALGGSQANSTTFPAIALLLGVYVSGIIVGALIFLEAEQTGRS